ncbi:diacylglycerol/lipid kinase family protein [Flavobacterium sp. RHBU_3]|uniref:diacylglycerol/lipid kinase family protein n=1 Tax=Flavobacterium sp. RHBU_3 TaxID=3391184 RepID=UPI00398535E4
MPTQKKFLLIINPIAGGNDKTELKEQVLQYATEQWIEIITYETTGKNDEAEIQKLYLEHVPSRILVAGGDGTIKLVGEAIGQHDVIVGILPAGSANGLSVDLNLPADIEEILQTAFHGKYIEMDMVSINGKKSLHLSDLGANAELIKNYESGNVRGKLGYAIHAFTTYKELGDPFNVSVTANGETLHSEARMVVIANTQKYGTGVTINPLGKMDDGKFEIVILKTLDLLFIGRILTGNMPVEDEEHVHIISTEKALITTDVPVSFQIDGEFCGQETKLDVFILPRQMRVAVP